MLLSEEFETPWGQRAAWNCGSVELMTPEGETQIITHLNTGYTEFTQSCEDEYYDHDFKLTPEQEKQYQDIITQYCAKEMEIHDIVRWAVEDYVDNYVETSSNPSAINTDAGKWEDFYDNALDVVIKALDDASQDRIPTDREDVAIFLSDFVNDWLDQALEAKDINKPMYESELEPV